MPEKTPTLSVRASTPLSPRASPSTPHDHHLLPRRRTTSTSHPDTTRSPSPLLPASSSSSRWALPRLLLLPAGAAPPPPPPVRSRPASSSCCPEPPCLLLLPSDADLQRRPATALALTCYSHGHYTACARWCQRPLPLRAPPPDPIHGLGRTCPASDPCLNGSDTSQRQALTSAQSRSRVEKQRGGSPIPPLQQAILSGDDTNRESLLSPVEFGFRCCVGQSGDHAVWLAVRLLPHSQGAMSLCWRRRITGLAVLYSLLCSYSRRMKQCHVMI
ncbi:hypothetical protein VPH35_082165 [Triticum aestivum]